MADPKHPRHYEESFKRQIVQLYENGKPAREIKDEYDISHSTLHRWPIKDREVFLQPEFCWMMFRIL